MDLTAVRRNIQFEETETGFAVSESFAQDMGSSVNFINNRQYDSKIWVMNGRYDRVAAPQTGIDCLFVIPWDMEILGVIFSNQVAGTSGTSEIDIQRYTAPGVVAGSIFTTKPQILSTATNGAYVGRVLVDGVATTIGGGTGMTAPLLSAEPFNLNQGDALRLDFTQKMVAGQSASLEIIVRPR